MLISGILLKKPKMLISKLAFIDKALINCSRNKFLLIAFNMVISTRCDI